MNIETIKRAESNLIEAGKAGGGLTVVIRVKDKQTGASHSFVPNAVPDGFDELSIIECGYKHGYKMVHSRATVGSDPETVSGQMRGTFIGKAEVGSTDKERHASRKAARTTMILLGLIPEDSAFDDDERTTKEAPRTVVTETVETPALAGV